MTDSLFDEIDRIFHPRSMASVGVSDRMENMGRGFLIGFQKQGFTGRLYAVNPNRKIQEFDSVDSILDIEGPVDYVKVSVGSRNVAAVIRDCVRKTVRCVTIFSSGFRESGTKEGALLEEEILAIARQGGVRLIGPNCMGLHYPDGGLSIRPDMPTLKGGDISLVAQSGGVAISLGMALSERGIPIQKAVSFGNEVDLGPPEFLHYLARDPATRVICLYVEGTRRPEALQAAIKDAAAHKPLIILKGGVTTVGSRAVSSHTGALAGTGAIWAGMARQAGAVLVEDFDELVDMAILFSLSRPPEGRRIGLLTISGGFGVYATDQVINSGFEMPSMADQTKFGMKQFIDAPGTSIHNPVDMAARFFQPDNFGKMFSILNSDPGIDAFIMICAMEYMTWLGSNQEKIAEFLSGEMIKAMKAFSKPIYIAFLHTVLGDLRLRLEKNMLAAGHPVFPSITRCLTAMGRSMHARR